MKKRMQRADDAGARFVAILGDDELAKGDIIVKNLSTGEQKEIAQSGLLEEVKSAA